jgi:hypothetical protein
MIIDRRLFLRMTGFVAAASALAGLPSTAQGLAAATSEMRAPGRYRITGQVRLDAPIVSISGITNAQQISWTPGSLSTPLAAFSSFEQFDRPWRMPNIQVSGGRLENVQVVALDFLG